MAERKPKKTAKKSAAKKSAAPADELPDMAANGGDAESAELADLMAELDQLPEVEVTADPPHVAYPDLDSQDHLDRGALTLDGTRSTDDDAVRTVRGAIAWAWDKVKRDVADWQGLCLRFVRQCFNVDALYPDAITAWVEADRKHRADNTEGKRGHAGFFRGGDFGHVVLLLGDGYCISTDVRDPGQANRCKVQSIVDNWGYQFLGWTDDINGEVAPRLPNTSQSKLTTREWRIRRLRMAISTARKNGNQRAVAKLRTWMNELRNRQAASGGS